MDKLGVALVGCGGIAGLFHLPAISLLGDRLELVAVCDRDMERAEEAAALHGGKAYDSLDRMLDEQKRIDIVAITVHAQHHHTIGIRAAQAGKHIILEKPIALTLPCADAMIQACRASGVKLEVAENYLRMPTDAAVNKIAASGVLGKVRTVQVTDAINGASIDIGVHRYSQLRAAACGWPTAITGNCFPTPVQPPERPQSLVENQAERQLGDTKDHLWAVGMVEFDNGVLGKCEYFPLYRPAPVWPGDLRRVVGDKGVITDDLWPNVYPTNAKGQFALNMFSGPREYAEIPMRRIEEECCGKMIPTRVEVDSDPPVVWENPVAHVFRAADASRMERTRAWVDWTVACVTAYYNFALAIQEDREPEYGAERGRSDLELTLATYESSRIHERIELPLTRLTEHERDAHAIFEARYGRPIL